MGIDHILYGISDQFPGGKAVEHAVMPHRNTIVHRNGVELFGDSAVQLNFPAPFAPNPSSEHGPVQTEVKEFTTAIIGLPKSSDFIPVARQSRRAPAMLRPWVEVLER